MVNKKVIRNFRFAVPPVHPHWTAGTAFFKTKYKKSNGDDTHAKKGG